MAKLLARGQKLEKEETIMSKENETEMDMLDIDENSTFDESQLVSNIDETVVKDDEVVEKTIDSDEVTEEENTEETSGHEENVTECVQENEHVVKLQIKENKANNLKLGEKLRLMNEMNDSIMNFIKQSCLKAAKEENVTSTYLLFDKELWNAVEPYLSKALPANLLKYKARKNAEKIKVTIEW